MASLASGLRVSVAEPQKPQNQYKQIYLNAMQKQQQQQQ